MEPLPEDVVLEILVRVTGIPDLFRCAATCKRWRLLIADNSFLRRRWPEGARHRASLLGFFSEQPLRRKRVTSGIIPSRAVPPFTPAPWSPFGPRSRFLTIPELRGHRAVPLASRCGLLLVSLIPYGGSLHGYDEIADLAVSGPLEGTIQVLPPLNYNGSNIRILGCTILTGADCCSDRRPRPAVSSINLAVCKVLIISFHAELRYHLHVFTSADSSWSTPMECFDPLLHMMPLQLRAAAVCQGTAHWLLRDMSNFYTLNVSAETANVSLTKLPVTPDNVGFNLYSQPVLSVTNDGELSLLRLYRKCVGLEIWARRGGNENEGGWHLAEVIRLKRPERSKIDLVQCVCVGEMSGALLIKDDQNCMYIADIETGAMETVTELFRGVGMGAIPFEKDWSAFFMSRLAGGRIKRAKQGGARPKVSNSFWGRIFSKFSLG